MMVVYKRKVLAFSLKYKTKKEGIYTILDFQHYQN